MKLKSLRTLPTLNVHQLSDKQLATADTVFADLKAYRMKPYNECATDAWRHVLDARLLAEVLGITDAEVHHGMQRLRRCCVPNRALQGQSEILQTSPPNAKSIICRGVKWKREKRWHASSARFPFAGFRFRLFWSRICRIKQDLQDLQDLQDEGSLRE